MISSSPGDILDPLAEGNQSGASVSGSFLGEPDLLADLSDLSVDFEKLRTQFFSF